jgi:hypothetical protein
MDFGEVLGRAWRIIWKHKILWIFGIFAGCSRGGGGGGGNSGYQFSSPNGQVPNNAMEQFGNWISNHPWVVALFILAILVIVVIGIVLGTLGRIGLIKGTQKADGGAEHLAFAQLWDESLPFFWRVFLLMLIVGLATFVLVLILVLLGIGAAVITLGIGLVCLIPLFCVLVLALWFAGLVVQMAEIAIVTEDLSIMDGVRRGWDVVKRNVGPVLIMWLILAVISFVVGLVIAIPVLVAVVPAAIAFAASGSQGASPNWLPLIIGLGCCAVYFPFLLVLNGILSAYLETAWTLTFLRVAGPKPSAESIDVPPENPIVPAPNA